MIENFALRTSLTGEPAAMGGYMGQYDLFAQRVYDEILKENLVCMSVADDRNGKLDDIYYETNDAIYAYQIKWSIAGDTVSFSWLKPLIKEVAQSWKKILYSKKKKVIPFLLSNMPPKDGDRIKDDKGNVIGSFTDFVREWKQQDTTGKWSDAVNQLQKVTELSELEFNDFINVFQLIVGADCERYKVSDKDSSPRGKDILDLRSLIMDSAGDEGRKSGYKLDEIVRLLGWGHKFAQIYNHALMVDEREYVPIHKTINNLEKAIENNLTGYIFLQGLPGSGKSSLLSYWSADTKIRTVSYFAFDFTDPSSHENISLRGEATSMLHDLIIAIKRCGFRVDTNHLMLCDLNELQDIFHSQLKMMGENFTNNGERTILIIDGLDHIAREYHDCQSEFIGYLPNPANIPDGVTIILGSQTFKNLQNLPPAVLQESRKKNRLVEMNSLSNEEIVLLLNKTMPDREFDEKLLKEIFMKTQGHPLYLTYVIENFRHGVKLQAMPDYNDDVELYYFRILGDILHQNGDLNDMLGMLSRVVGVVNFDFIKEWGFGAEIERLFAEKVVPLLKYDNRDDTVSFFHNSFRQFLLSETSRNLIIDNYDETRDKNYYSRLADSYLRSNIEPASDASQYLYQAGRYEDFLKQTTPDQLEQQYLNYRSVRDIHRDVNYGLLIGLKKNDPYIVIRYMLMTRELDLRNQQDYSALNLVDSFIDWGDIKQAKSLLYRGTTINCTIDYALKCSRKLFMKGNKEDGKALFDISYPDFLYTYTKHHNRYNEFSDELKTLKKWLRSAVYYLPDSDVYAKEELFLRHLSKVASDVNRRYSEADILYHLESEIMKSLFDLKDYNRFDIKINENIHKGEAFLSATLNALRYAVKQASDNGDKSLAKKYYDIEKDKFSGFADSIKIIIAETGWRLNHDVEEVRSTLGDLKPEMLDVNYSPEYEKMIVYRPLFRLVKLRKIAFGEDLSLDDIVIESPNDKRNIYIAKQFVRNICLLAKIKADAELGNPLPYKFNYTIKQMMKFFMLYSHDNDFPYEYRAFYSDYFILIVNVVASYSKAGIAMMKDVMQDDELRNNIDSNAWRVMIVELSHYNDDKKFLSDELTRLEGRMFDYQDQSGRLEQCYQQACAWKDFGYKAKSLSVYRKMLEETLNVGYSKDDQPHWFANNIGRINKFDPSHALDRLHWITQRLHSLQVVTDNSGFSYTMDALLGAAYSHNIITGLKLTLWALDEDFTIFTTAFTILIYNLLNVVSNKDDFCKIVDAYCILYLYVDHFEDGHHRLLRHIIETGHRLYGDKIDKAIVEKLDHAVKVQCIVSLQAGYLDIIHEIKKEIVKSTEHNDEDRKKEPSTFDYLKLAEEKLSNNLSDEAWISCLNALKKSQSSGWVEYNDGGTRIKTFETMLKIHPEETRHIAFKTLVKDILDGSINSIVTQIDKIMPLIINQVDEGKLFDEKFDYMNKILRDVTVRAEDAPDLEVEDYSIGAVLTKFLLHFNKTYQPEFEKRAAYLIALMMDGEVAVLISECGDKQITLDVAMTLVAMKSDKTNLIHEQIVPLATSNNLLWRVYAKEYLSYIGETPKALSYRRLSPLYSIILDDPTLFIKKDDRYIDRDNPVAMTKIVEPIINHLCKMHNLNPTTISYMIMKYARNYQTEDELSEEYETRHRNHFQEIYLKLDFFRPYVYGALNGSCEVAADFVDCNYENEGFIRIMLERQDYEEMLWPVYERPNFVSFLSKNGMASIRDDWEQKCDESPRLNQPLQKYDGMAVIGERTFMMNRGSENPQECYDQKIAWEGEKPDEKEFFNSNPMQRLGRDYHEIECYEEKMIVIRTSYYSIHQRKADWLAFNPDIARNLGWKPLEDRLFAWQNSDDKLMVESRYWRQGSTYNYDIRFNDVSEGWLVLATPEAINELNTYYGKQMIQHKRINRIYCKSNELKTNTSVYSEKI